MIPPSITSKWLHKMVREKSRDHIGYVEEIRYRQGKYYARITWDRGGHDLVHLASLALVDDGGAS